jgi:hypothetical protein
MRKGLGMASFRASLALFGRSAMMEYRTVVAKSPMKMGLFSVLRRSFDDPDRLESGA